MAEDTRRLNVVIPAETKKNVKIVAAETGLTVAEATDYLLKKGIDHYVGEAE